MIAFAIYKCIMPSPSFATHSPSLNSFILRTSPGLSSPLLGLWDQLMMSIVSKITKLDFIQGSPSWLQATLPINSRSLGLLSVSSLASSAFLASADEASDLMQQLLPVQFLSVPYPDRDCAFSTWKDALPVDTLVLSITSRQKLWDQPTVHFGQLYQSDITISINRHSLQGVWSLVKCSTNLLTGLSYVQ